MKTAIALLILTKVTTDVCVQTTMGAANDRAYACLVETTTEGYSSEFKQTTLAMIRAQGNIIGWAAMVYQILAGLVQLS